MAAGLTLNAEDLTLHGTPAAHQAGKAQSYYPIEMMRALVGVWLFAGCRIDEIRRLDLDCIIWQTGRDEQTGRGLPGLSAAGPAEQDLPGVQQAR
jgi:hypothetical protein